jgi:hypothetical protein
VVYDLSHHAGQLGENGLREGESKGWSTILVNALGSWEKTVLEKETLKGGLLC